MDKQRPKVVIVGGGFGGLETAKRLRKVDVDVTLVDRHNYHLFQPLLYQVATGGLSPANIATPLRMILRRQSNCDIVLGEVVDIDVSQQRVLLADSDLAYDYLILATGSTHSYFGNDAWQPLAPGLKSIGDATEIRRRIYRAFETADRTGDADSRRRLMTFVVVGGGPTGIELAGALAEIAKHTLKHDFRHINPEDARILSVVVGLGLVFYATQLGSDDEVSDRIVRVLEDHPQIDASTLRVSVEDGVATITGQIPTDDIRRIVVDEVEQVDGVERVIDEMTIELPPE